ncbi:ABC transporter ATP-binding protein [Devosia sp.]|uniref:ABC transporter ATP-binding protein n=1 Tax=Devosia sp. TaxID=1871048 RepID=UPI003A8F43C2
MSLVVADARLTRDSKPILDGAGLTAPSGSLHGLIGPNGAGKSTLLRAILGLEPLDRGSVQFDGADFLSLPRGARARRAAYVEQISGTETPMAVSDVVMLGRIPFQSVWQATPTRDDEAAVTQALDAVGMTAFANRSFTTLSGGEQQKVLVARALAQSPSLLVLDEPTNHLDVAAQLGMLALLRRHAASGMTIVVALHDLNLAAQYCDGLTVMAAGRTIVAGAPEAVLTPELLRTVYGVDADIVVHPRSGRPLIAYALPTAPNASGPKQH